MSVHILGHTVSKPAAVAIAGGSALAIYFAYRQHKAGGGGSSPSSLDPVTGLPYSQDNVIDPLTGQAYLAEAQQYGSVSAAESAVAGESSLAYSNAASGGGLVGSSSAGSTTISSGGYASNAAWAQAVTAGLTSLGYTSTDVSAALGMYLGGLPLTNLPDGQSAASIVQAALAEFGPPPVGSFTVIMPGTGPTGSGDGSGGTTPPPPPPGGGTTPPPHPTPPPVVRAGPISNLHISGYDHTGVTFAWNAASNAKQGYHWALTSVEGQGITKSGNTSNTHVSVTGLKKGVYNFGVQGLPGGPGNNIHTPSLKG